MHHADEVREHGPRLGLAHPFEVGRLGSRQEDRSVGAQEEAAAPIGLRLVHSCAEVSHQVAAEDRRTFVSQAQNGQAVHELISDTRHACEVPFR